VCASFATMASLRAILVVAAVEGVLSQQCGDITVRGHGGEAPQKCLDSGCSWLMLDGRCVAHTSAELAAFPDCCVGPSCNLKRVEDATDGTCAVASLANTRPEVTAPPLEDIVRYFHLAAAAYCPVDTVSSWSCGLHCDPVSGISVRTRFEKHNFAGYVAHDAVANRIIVAFRGTDSGDIENWKSNLDSHRIEPFSQYPLASVHEGFWKAWLTVKDEVLSGIALIQTEFGALPLHVTGHSLGGAMATDAAFDLVLNHGFTAGAYTFGSPRAGNYVYAAILGQRLSYHFRVTHNNDVVPHLPARSFGFHHPGSEIHFPERQGLGYKLCDGTGEDSSCADACAIYLTCTSVDDHLTYLDMPATCGMDVADAAVVVV